jgi:tRNA pseudouridine38-40 synthase
VPRQRIALGLEYDGSPYEGWQTQPHGRTVQDVLEHALACFANEPLATICAGRTDAGVHARGQVVHFDTERERTEQSWVRGVNRYLPPQVAVRWARPVDTQFHARYSARARHYEYWILNDAVRAPLLDRRAGWVFRPLDLAAMQAAAALLLGTHDYTSFRSAQCQAATAVRTLTRCEVLPAADGLVHLRFTANAFLHHMVRNLVGSLVEVGLGRRDAAWLGEVLAARDRSRAAATMDAAGLYFTGVAYDPAFGLPAGGGMPARFPDEGEGR